MTSILVPVVSNSSPMEDISLSNDEGDGRYFSKLSGNHTYVYDSSGLTLDGVKIYDPSSNMILFSDDVFIKGSDSHLLEYAGKSANHISYFDGTSATITISDGSISCTVDGQVKFQDRVPSWGYSAVPKATGTHIMKTSEQSFYVSSMEQVIACGIRSSGYYTFYEGEVTFKSNVVGQTYTAISNLAEGTVDVQEVESFALTFSGTSSSPSTFLVPVVIDGHYQNNQYQIYIEIIPLVVILGLVLGAVSVVIRGKSQ